MELNDKIYAYDQAHKIQEAVINLCDMINILTVGFRCTGYDAKKQAESTLYIISQYLESLLEQDLSALLEQLTKMREENK